MQRRGGAYGMQRRGGAYGMQRRGGAYVMQRRGLCHAEEGLWHAMKQTSRGHTNTMDC